MANIEFRYRDYKDPKKRGTYLLVNGRQVQRVSYRQLTTREIADLRKKYILAQKGFIQQTKNTYRQQIDEDLIKEVKLGDLNDEVADITKDSTTGKWEKEKSQDREYVDPENPSQLQKSIEQPPQEPDTP